MRGDLIVGLQQPHKGKWRGRYRSLHPHDPRKDPRERPGAESGRLRLDVRTRFFTQRVPGLPREVVTAPKLTEFQKRLDNTLEHTVSLLGMVLCSAGSWT